ncbi:tRNA methyltransferase complex GCD14 subunit-domain-containing protein [Panaeolus papilionaceus]|nr:tRNA methyltransferase complex GCD14 subunit-domain-containing protein [Panaeolus papilionaceus]
MWSTAREIAEGDTVIIWLTRDLIQPLTITPGKDYNTKFGNFKHTDFIGVPYGSKVAARTSSSGGAARGFVIVLRPTPELWTLALPHRTQILYLADIAFIVSWLGIKNGSRVIEAGTGSGSFSHSVARTVGSTGKLFSFEFHEARFLKAKDEFESHGMADIVTLQHRNVCKEGFALSHEVDAVFLDLPAPWDAIASAKEALKKDRLGRICCFSPCIEQVLRTVNALNEHGFTEITTYETLLRPIEVFQTPPLLPVSALSEKLKESERRREDKRLRQIEANKRALAQNGVDGAGKKRKRDATTGSGEPSAAADAEILEEDTEVKRVKVDAEVEEMDVDEQVQDVTAPAVIEESSASSSAPARPGSRLSRGADISALSKTNISKALPEVRGHTSYLTFALLVPYRDPNAPSTSAPPKTNEQASTTQQADRAESTPMSNTDGEKTGGRS